MNSKPFVWVGMVLGSIAGSYVPALWGDAGIFSFSSLIFGSLGAILGIYICFKISQM